MLLGEGEKGLGAPDAYKVLVFSHFCYAACAQLQLE